MAKNKKSGNSSAEQLGTAQVGGEQLGGDLVGGDQVGTAQVGGEQLGGELVGGDQVGTAQVGGDTAELLNPDEQLAELESIENDEAQELERLGKALRDVRVLLKEVQKTGGHVLSALNLFSLRAAIRLIDCALKPQPEGS